MTARRFLDDIFWPILIGLALGAAIILTLIVGESRHPANSKPRTCHEDQMCWSALIDGNHLGHYIVGWSDAPTSSPR